MNWTFQYEGEWSAPSIKNYAKFLSIWRIGICEDGSFCISGSDPNLTMHRGTFATLAKAKAFCEMLEMGYASEADLRNSKERERARGKQS